MCWLKGLSHLTKLRIGGIGLPRWLSLLDILMIIALLASIHSMLGRGIQTKFPDPFYRHTASLAIAISEMQFGTTDYTGLTEVFEILQANGLNSKYLPMYKSKEDSREIVERALKAAQNYTPTPESMNNIMAVHSNEVGSVELFKISLKLFGYTPESFSYLYFTFLTITAVSFIISFRGSDSYLKGFGIVFILINDAFFGTFNVMPHGSRMFPALSLFAILYIVCLSWSNARPALRTTLPCLLISIIIALLLNARSLIAWQIIMVFGLTCAVIALRHWPVRWLSHIRFTRLWPLCTLLAICFVGKIYSEHHKSSLYAEDTAMGHPYWSSVIGTFSDRLLFMVPDLSASYGKNVEDTDSFFEALVVREINLRGHKLEDYLTPDQQAWHETMREDVAFSAFARMWRTFPLQIAKVYLERIFVQLPGEAYSLKFSYFHIIMAGLLLLSFSKVDASKLRRARAFCLLIIGGWLFVAFNTILMPHVAPTRVDNYLYVLLMTAAAIVGIFLLCKSQTSEPRNQGNA